MREQVVSEPDLVCRDSLWGDRTSLRSIVKALGNVQAVLVKKEMSYYHLKTIVNM